MGGGEGGGGGRVGIVLDNGEELYWIVNREISLTLNRFMALGQILFLFNGLRRNVWILIKY